MKSFTKVVVIGLISLALKGCGGEAGERNRESEIIRVNVAELQAANSYTVTREFSGRVEAPRQSQLGFEVAGELVEVRVNEGDAVDAGDLLARLDADRLGAAAKEARAALSQAQAEQELAASTLLRSEAALEFDGVSAQELDQAKQVAAAASAGVAAARARIQRIELDINKSSLRAPYAATVIGRMADEGEIVATGRPILSLQEIGEREVRLGLSRDAAAGLAVGDTAQLQIGNTEVSGVLSAIVAARDPTTRTIDVKYVLDSASALPGDLAHLVIDKALDGDGFWVPLSALVEGNRGLWSIYVVEPLPSKEVATHSLSARAIDVIHHQGEQLYVRGAIQPGELYVTEGIQRVVSGQQVRVVVTSDDN